MNEVAGPKQIQHLVFHVFGDKRKIWCCQEEYCLETWNVRSPNQGKLDVVKQDMVRININILGITKLKWTGMGEFNSDDHCIYYYEQESHRRNGVALIINQSLKYSTWVQPQKWQNDLVSFPRQIIQYHSNPSLWPHHQCQRSWSWPSWPWRPTTSSRSNTKKMS